MVGGGMSGGVASGRKGRQKAEAGARERGLGGKGREAPRGMGKLQKMCSLALQLVHQLGVAPADDHQLAVGADVLQGQGAVQGNARDA